MLDELLDERRSDFLHESHQKEITAEYCSALEKQARTASIQQEAKDLVDASCQNFKQSCPSTIVRTFLVSYAESLLDRHWRTRP